MPDYVEVAFRAARVADPDTLLFYNDFAAEEAGTPKSDVVYNMLKTLLGACRSMESGSRIIARERI